MTELGWLLLSRNMRHHAFFKCCQNLLSGPLVMDRNESYVPCPHLIIDREVKQNSFVRERESRKERKRERERKKNREAKRTSCCFK